MPISDENLARLRTVLRELQTVVDDIEAEKNPTSDDPTEADRMALREVIGPFLSDPVSSQDQETSDEIAPTTVVILPSAKQIQERVRRAEERKRDGKE